MLTAETVLNDVIDAILDDDALASAHRPDGLTMSYIGHCQSEAVRILRGEPGGEEHDRWGGIRGGMMHAGLKAAIDRVRPGWATEQRVNWRPWFDLPPISGQYDLLRPDGDTVIVVDYKTRPASACRGLAKMIWRAHHDEDLQKRAKLADAPAVKNVCCQLAGLAAANGATQAFALFVPTDGDFDDFRCVEIDVARWTTVAAIWYRDVQQVAADPDVDIDDVPRDEEAPLCEAICGFFDTCRAGYVQHEVITDPVQVQAAYDHRVAAEAEAFAKKEREAAAALLAGVRGVTPDGTVKVSWITVEETLDRVGYSYTRTARRDPLGRPVRRKAGTAA